LLQLQHPLLLLLLLTWEEMRMSIHDIPALDLNDLDIAPLTPGRAVTNPSLESLMGDAVHEMAASCAPTCSCCAFCCCCCFT
jgi:hypothetical protein